MEKERLNHATERDTVRLDHNIERDALNQQCAVLAKQNDRLIQKCDDASADAESERTRARDIEAACDRAFDELKRQASQTAQQASQIAACSDWRGLTTDASAGTGAGGAGRR